MSICAEGRQRSKGVEGGREAEKGSSREGQETVGGNDGK